MFRNRIRELREAAGYKSQQSFADAFGVAQSTIGNWEAGKRKPNQETTIRLAQFLGTTTDYLLGTDKEKPTPEGELSAEERKFFEWYRTQATERDKAIIRAFMEGEK